MSGALKHPNQHPLRVLFYTRKLCDRAGMNLLQEGPELFISDNCVRLEEVAPCDVDAVLERAGAPWAKSQLYPWRPEA